MQLPDDPQIVFWLKSAAYTLLSITAGFLGYIMRTLDHRKQINWWRALLEASAAGLVGGLVLLICNALTLSDQWTGVIVGVMGWLGANASIKVLEVMVYRKLGIDKPEGDQIMESEHDDKIG